MRESNLPITKPSHNCSTIIIFLSLNFIDLWHWSTPLLPSSFIIKIVSSSRLRFPPLWLQTTNSIKKRKGSNPLDHPYELIRHLRPLLMLPRKIVEEKNLHFYSSVNVPLPAIVGWKNRIQIRNHPLQTVLDLGNTWFHSEPNPFSSLHAQNILLEATPNTIEKRLCKRPTPTQSSNQSTIFEAFF